MDPIKIENEETFRQCKDLIDTLESPKDAPQSMPDSNELKKILTAQHFRALQSLWVTHLRECADIDKVLSCHPSYAKEYACYVEQHPFSLTVEEDFLAH